MKSVLKNRKPNAVERKSGEEKGQHLLFHPQTWACSLKRLISKMTQRSRLTPVQEPEGRARIESLPFEGKRESYMLLHFLAFRLDILSGANFERDGFDCNPSIQAACANPVSIHDV